MAKAEYVFDFLRAAAKKHGRKDFLVCPDRTLSWADAEKESLRIASFVAKQLNGKQQRTIGLLLPDSWQFVIAYFGIVGSGSIAMPLDVTFKKLEFDFVTKAIEPEFVIVNRQTSHLIDGPKVFIEDMLQAKSSAELIEPQLTPDKQIATLFFSSGTTGIPKPIPNTHTNQIWDVEAIAGPMAWTEKDRLLITLHLAHRHGLVICLFGAVYHGNTVYLEERFNPKRTLELLESGKISLYSSVPAAYAKLVDAEVMAGYDLSAVRLFASSSSPLSPALERAFQERFGHHILDRYGTSETGSIAIKTESSDRTFSEPLKGVEIRLEPGGEVALKSPGLFPGYYKNKPATLQNMTKDGWWLTGDIGELQGGRLVLKGRAKERISKGGYSVFPQDIEWAISQNPGVREVKVTSLPQPDDNLNPEDKVFAFFTGSASEEDLMSFAKDNLPRSWRPDIYIKIGQIPKTANGKPRIAELKKLAKQAA